MKSWDAIIIGGGIIGVSLALSLRKHGADVLIIDRNEPGREASHAAAGMLACCDPHTPEPLRRLCLASSSLYPEYVHEIQNESGADVDLRSDGTLYVHRPGESFPCDGAHPVDGNMLEKLEPCLAEMSGQVWFLPEKSVDPRALIAAALKAAKHREIHVAFGDPVTELQTDGGRVSGVKTSRAHFLSATVVNCAGAWASAISGGAFPTRPVKGQMLSVVPREHNLLKHVVRAPDVYLLPRTDGRILIGATVEDAGFDKRVDPATIQRMHQAAADLAPDLGEAKMLEAWAGLRPGTPDDLPIMGATSIPGYFAATGHFRDGILLAPITAQIMTQVIRGADPGFDIVPFSPLRFAS